MRSVILTTTVIIGLGLQACTQQKQSDSTPQQQDTTMTQPNPKTETNNLVSIVEIPTANFPRAVAFYQTILDIKIEETSMDGIKMGQFPQGGNVFVQLINGSDYKPSADGTVVYLNGGDDLQKIADKIAANGGKVVVPKTLIAPEIGYFAIFTDTEGNKLGLHSLH